MLYLMKATHKDGEVYFANRNVRGHVELMRDPKMASKFTYADACELLRRSRNQLEEWHFEFVEAGE